MTSIIFNCLRPHLGRLRQLTLLEKSLELQWILSKLHAKWVPVLANIQQYTGFSKCFEVGVRAGRVGGYDKLRAARSLIIGGVVKSNRRDTIHRHSWPTQCSRVCKWVIVNMVSHLEAFQCKRVLLAKQKDWKLQVLFLKTQYCPLSIACCNLLQLAAIFVMLKFWGFCLLSE